jgi:hypothetical protein
MADDPTQDTGPEPSEAPSDQEGDAPHMKVDEGWKEQVRQERQQDAPDAQGQAAEAADQEDQAQPQAAPEDEPQGPPPGKPTLPVLINSLATQVFVSLGLVEDPISGKKRRSLEQAKFSIDLLDVLSEKTQGNLTQQEDRYLQGVLHELRMRYVEATRQPDQGGEAAPHDSSSPSNES